MNLPRILPAIALMFFVSDRLSSQNLVDSMKRELTKATHDTVRIMLRNQLGFAQRIFRVSYWDSLAADEKLLAEQEQKDTISRKFYWHYHASALSNMAFILNMQGQPLAAIDLFGKATAIFRNIRSYDRVISSLISMSRIYDIQGSKAKALDYLHDALKLSRATKNKATEAQCLNNIGDIFVSQQEYAKGHQVHLEALAIRKSMPELRKTAESLNNIGSVYQKLEEFEKARVYFNEALKLYHEQKNEQMEAITLNNLATTYKNGKDADNKALAYYKEAQSILERIGDQEYIGSVKANIAEALLLKNKLPEALSIGLQGLRYTQAAGFTEEISFSAGILKKIYEKQGNYRKALEMHELYISTRDSVNSEQNRRAGLKKQFQIEYEMQAERDSLMNAARAKEQQMLHQQAITRQRTYTYGGAAGFGLMLIVAVISLQGYRNKKKANLIIMDQKRITEIQKQQLEEKQREIMDSIHYAQGIQSAILAREDLIKKSFPESFLLYLPKDVVAGDFYFFERTTEHVFFAAADCTGHGVPGALVSVVCSNALRRSIREFALTDPGEILTKARELVLETFSGSGREIKDGMDISFLSKNISDNSLSWAGANNPFWYTEGQEMKEIRADKQPVGWSDQAQPFTTHRLNLPAGAMLYLLTDGYADQFGGPNGKKFKYKQLSNLLAANQALSCERQKEILEAEFQLWRGELEQVDDVCIIGLRV